MSEPQGLGTLVPSEAGIDESSESSVQGISKSQIPDRQFPDSSIPPIIIDTGSPWVASRLTLNSALGGWLFSYAAATAITGLAILGAWAYKVSLEGGAGVASVHVAATDQPPSAPGKPERELVGRITGTADCRWANPDDAPTAAVPLGRKYALAAGLMEITYATGAKVILQGPCTYEIESPSSGFLSLGKLTARVEKVVSGQWSVVSDAKSQAHYPQATSHYPLFSVRTPTATVTDLGTEFGVEVSEEGNTTSHVFRGSVSVALAARSGVEGSRREVVLRESESARVERGAGSPQFAPQGAVVESSPLRPAAGRATHRARSVGHRRRRQRDGPSPRGRHRPYQWRGGSPLLYGRPLGQSPIPPGPLEFRPSAEPDRRRVRAGWRAGPGRARLCRAHIRPVPTDLWQGGRLDLARAAEVKAETRPSYWIYALGSAKQYMPKGRGLLALHSNAGITFDLEAMRDCTRTHGLVVSRASPLWPMLRACFPATSPARWRWPISGCSWTAS